MSSHVLLTGATGFLGQYLLGDLLRRNIPVAVLMRSQKQAAESRMESVLSWLEEDLKQELPRPVCLQGDIALPRLGMTREAWRWAADHCGRVLHNAACVTFKGSDRQSDPWLSNVTGTANVLEFCRQAGVRQFHYMSTAYVCGKRSGVIFEDDCFDPGEFRNDYEQSKFEAEKLVREAGFLHRPTIYRPSIIVGDSRTGRTTTYHGVYAFIRLAWLIQQGSKRDAAGRFHISLRYAKTGEERMNLVPVDWVSAATVQILLDDSQHGRTYHLTPLKAMTLREMDEAGASYFNYYGESFLGPHGLDRVELSDLEKLFYGQMTGYNDYWREEPAFDCRNTTSALPHLPCPSVDRQFFHRLCEYAVADNFGRPKRK